MLFEQFSFDPRIIAGIKTAGYTNPTPIQQQAIPVVLKKLEIPVKSHTRSGLIRTVRWKK